MKHSVIFTTAIVMALSSQFVIAGSITDTYSTGDTLTSTQMNNIKTAVNDNDTKTVMDIDIGDEPGIEFTNFSNLVQTSVPVTYTSIETVTVSAPTSGFVTCIATGSLDVDDTTISTGFVNFGWDLNNNTIGVAPDGIGWVGTSGPGTNSTYVPYTSMYTWPVSSGTNNFYFKVKTSTGDATDFDFIENSYACMFYPTRY